MGAPFFSIDSQLRVQREHVVDQIFLGAERSGATALKASVLLVGGAPVSGLCTEAHLMGCYVLFPVLFVGKDPIAVQIIILATEWESRVIFEVLVSHPRSASVARIRNEGCRVALFHTNLLPRILVGCEDGCLSHER
jgi:hypothetical protein